jgi:hypothetical protein
MAFVIVVVGAVAAGGCGSPCDGQPVVTRNAVVLEVTTAPMAAAGRFTINADNPDSTCVAGLSLSVQGGRPDARALAVLELPDHFVLPSEAFLRRGLVIDGTPVHQTLPLEADCPAEGCLQGRFTVSVNAIDDVVAPDVLDAVVSVGVDVRVGFDEAGGSAELTLDP